MTKYDELAALVERAATAQRNCPADKRCLGEKACPNCGAHATEGCVPKTLAALRLAYFSTDNADLIIEALREYEERKQ